MQDPMSGDPGVNDSLVLSDSNDFGKELSDALIDGDLNKALGILINNDCDVNIRDSYGNEFTPLFSCIYEGTEEFPQDETRVGVLNLLLSIPGCDVNAVNEHGESPLHAACMQNRCATAALKLAGDARCKLTQQDRWGFTALHQLLREERHSAEHVCVILKEMRRNPTFLDCVSLTTSQGFSALDLFLMNSRFNRFELETSDAAKSIFQILISYENMVTPRTAALAGMYCSWEIYDAILSMNNEFHKSSALPNEETALHCVVRRNSHARVRRMVSIGPDFEKKWMRQNSKELAMSYQCDSRIISDLSDGSCVDSLPVIDKRTAGINSFKKGATLEHNWVEFKEKLSTVLRPDEKYEDISRSGDQEAVSIIRNYALFFDIFDDETQLITKWTLDLFQYLSNVLLKSKQYSHFVFTPVLAGSMSEKSRCYLPNEMDILCVFDEHSDLSPSYQGTSMLIKPKNSRTKWRHICANPNFLCARNMAQEFYMAMDSAIVTMVSTSNTLGSILVSDCSLQIMDKISRLQLIWKGRMFHGMIIHVDIVPAFRCKTYQSHSLPFDSQNVEFYALAKAFRHDFFPEVVFPVSLCQAEKRFWNMLSTNQKEGYRLAKALRISKVVRPGLDIGILHTSEDIDTSDVITSYILKNCMYCRIKCAGTIDDNNRDKYDWADDIYATLEKMLIARLIPSWDDGRRPLLNCSNCVSSHACCMRRNVMRILVVQIRNWFRRNRELCENVQKTNGLGYDVRSLLEEI